MFMIKGKEYHVYKLKKVLYSLKQAPRDWYSRIDSYFNKNCFQRSASEPTMYIKVVSKSFLLFVYLYVHDIMYTGSISLINDFRKKMMADLKCLTLEYFTIFFVWKSSKQGLEFLFHKSNTLLICLENLEYQTAARLMYL